MQLPKHDYQHGSLQSLGLIQPLPAAIAFNPVTVSLGITAAAVIIPLMVGLTIKFCRAHRYRELQKQITYLEFLWTCNNDQDVR